MKVKASLISFCLFIMISFKAISVPLSGTYTIGGTLPSYTSLTAAVSDLIANGVNGPVVFNIRNGIYTEQVSIPPITGASALNRITFQSESGVAANVLITFQNTSANNYVIQLNGASYITIKNLTLTTTDPTKNYGAVIAILNQASYDSISGNVLNGLQNTTWTGNNQVIFGYPHTGTSVVVNNNIINYGTIGIIIQGTDNGANISKKTVIKNNILNNFFGWGISANYMKEGLIEGNVLTTSPTPAYGTIPIYIQNIVFPLCVAKNKITITGTNSSIAGMYIVNNHPTSANDASIISNNFISMKNGTGLLLINNDYFKFYHNTVHVISSGSCFNVYGSSIGNILTNNLFYQAGNQSAISASPPAAVSISDYNSIYTTASVFGNWNGTNCANLTAWRAASGKDANSQSLVPSFVSPTDLHLTTYTPMQFGTTIPDVPDDIDGHSHNSSPAVGADDNGPVFTGNPNLCCACGNHIAAAFMANTTSVCAGGSVTFTDQSLNNPASWNWSFPGGTPSGSGSQHPTVTYNTAGTYDVKLLVINGSGSDSITKTAYITVHPLPEAGNVTANPDTVCSGASTQLNASGTLGSIQWQSSSDGISFTNVPGDTLSVYNTPGLSQITYYRIQASNTCGTDSSASLKLVVHPSPVPVLSTADTLICSGDSTFICSSLANNYLWNTGETSSCIYAKNAGGYWTTVTDANGCSAVSDHQEISVYPVPSVSIIVQGDTLSSFNAVSYQWYRNDTLIPGATSAIYTASVSGDYSVQVTDNNGCVATSSNVYIIKTDIEGMETYQSTIFPNPFSDFITLESGHIENIEIYDLSGRLVFRKAFEFARAISKVDVDLSTLPPSVYCIKINSKDKIHTQRITKQ